VNVTAFARTSPSMSLPHRSSSVVRVRQSYQTRGLRDVIEQPGGPILVLTDEDTGKQRKLVATGRPGVFSFNCPSFASRPGGACTGGHNPNKTSGLHEGRKATEPIESKAPQIDSHWQAPQNTVIVWRSVRCSKSHCHCLPSFHSVAHPSFPGFPSAPVASSSIGK